jgi:hypothetical protein
VSASSFIKVRYAISAAAIKGGAVGHSAISAHAFCTVLCKGDDREKHIITGYCRLALTLGMSVATAGPASNNLGAVHYQAMISQQMARNYLSFMNSDTYARARLKHP